MNIIIVLVIIIYLHERGFSCRVLVAAAPIEAQTAWFPLRSWPFAELAPIRSSQTMLQCLPPVAKKSLGTWWKWGKELTNSHDHTGVLDKNICHPWYFARAFPDWWTLWKLKTHFSYINVTLLLVKFSCLLPKYHSCQWNPQYLHSQTKTFLR